MAGIGIALLFVAAFHLVPAVLKQSIPTTLGKPIRRSESPGHFWATCVVVGAAALLGLGLFVAALF